MFVGRIAAAIFMVATAAVSAQMPAEAADLAARPYTKAVAVEPGYNWSGFYVGVNGGYGWKDSTTVTVSPNDTAAFLGTCGGVGLGGCIPPSSFGIAGGMAGGQIGYNWQVDSSWLFGVEADLDWAHLTGTASSPFRLGSVGATQFVASERVNSFGTLRGRLGWIPAAPLLLFATGGLAYGNVSTNLSVGNPITTPGTGSQGGGGFSYFCEFGGPSCFAGASSKTMVGWTIGAGAEYMISRNLSLKAEYLYANLGHLSGISSATGTFGGTAPASFTADLGSVSLNVVRVGLNYSFH